MSSNEDINNLSEAYTQINEEPLTVAALGTAAALGGAAAGGAMGASKVVDEDSQAMNITRSKGHPGGPPSKGGISGAGGYFMDKKYGDKKDKDLLLGKCKFDKAYEGKMKKYTGINEMEDDTKSTLKKAIGTVAGGALGAMGGHAVGTSIGGSAGRAAGAKADAV